jgi:hypothetical protein
MVDPSCFDRLDVEDHRKRWTWPPLLGLTRYVENIVPSVRKSPLFYFRWFTTLLNEEVQFFKVGIFRFQVCKPVL